MLLVHILTAEIAVSEIVRHPQHLSIVSPRINHMHVVERTIRGPSSRGLNPTRPVHSQASDPVPVQGHERGLASPDRIRAILHPPQLTSDRAVLGLLLFYIQDMNFNY